MLPRFLRYILLVLLSLLKIHGLFLSVYHYFGINHKCPPIASNICLTSAKVLTERIRKRQISCRTVIKTYIKRIKAVNPIINAVVDERFEDAIVDATNVDEMLLTTTLSIEELATKYPLLGLPITVKECISTEGLSWTCGKYFVNGRLAKCDAQAVSKLKKAGGIILLVSNVPELCLNSETYNSTTGETVNPYDTRRTSGGSSGGEGALLGSGASLVGLGTDLFGSIRLPAHHCGVWGHKPTRAVVSVNGHYPGVDQEVALEQVMTFGPMCRYGKDLRLLLDVLVKDDMRTVLKLNEQVSLSNLKIYYLELNDKSILTNRVDDSILKAIEKFCSCMRNKHGCQVEKIQINELKYNLEVALLPVLDVMNRSKEIYSDENVFKTLALYFLNKSNSVFPAIIPNIVKPFSNWFLNYVRNYALILDSLREKLDTLLGSDGILVLPCHSSQAPFRGQFAEKLIDYSYLGIFNALGFPATSCPFGLTSDGLPIGIQIISTLYNDRVCLSVAEEIEKEFGGWIPPQFL